MRNENTEALYMGLTVDTLRANHTHLRAAWVSLGSVGGSSAMAITAARMQVEAELRRIERECTRRGVQAVL